MQQQSLQKQHSEEFKFQVLPTFIAASADCSNCSV